jgi:uncharacterized protein YjbI with pentapeptide repeats
MYPVSNEYVIMQLEKKDLSNLDFTNYHIDPRSSFADSNLENANFENTWFAFDFDHETDFSYTFLVGTRFPAQGTAYRPSGKKTKQNNNDDSVKHAILNKCTIRCSIQAGRCNRHCIDIIVYKIK